MPLETPRGEEPSDDLLIDVTNNPNDTRESQEIVYPEDNEEDSDETTSLIKKQPVDRSLENSDSTTTKKKKKLFSIKNVLKLLLLILFILLIVVLLVVFRVQDHITDYLHYVEKHKKYGILIYLAIYTICVWLFLPGSIISIAAGFLFKPPILAGAIIIIGDVLGALGTFIFGRYIFSDWVKAQMEKRPMFTALNSVIAEEGWKIVVMLRLTPLPFNLISYFFSVSSIDLFPFLWATALGVLPGTFNAVWIGSLVKSLSGIDSPKLENKDIVIISMNIIFVLCCVIALSMLGKRSLRKAMLKLQTSKDSTNNSLAQDASTESVPDAENPLVEEESSVSSEAGNFTRGERITLVVIGIVAFLNLAISVPLYFYFKAHDVSDPGNVKWFMAYV